MSALVADSTSAVLWGVFAATVLTVMVLDLGVLHRGERDLSPRGATLFCAFVVGLSLAFGGLIWLLRGSTPALAFYTGYMVEEALSIDNLFVFLLVFQSFKVPPAHQSRVLFWGIFGALAMRAVFIAAGVALISRFVWLFDVFGAILVFTALRLLRGESADAAPTDAFWVKLYRRVVPSTPQLHGGRFLIKQNGRTLATPLLLVLVMVEVSDIVFAVDSIPAIFAITTEPFLVYTSNVFAILGLRSLYFVLSSMLARFAYLRFGLCAVLLFVGAKMLLRNLWHPSAILSLAIIFACLGLAIVCSLLHKAK